MGTRFGAKLPGPPPPQKYVNDLRGSFSCQAIWVRHVVCSCPLIVARVPQEGRLAAHRVSGQGRINRLIVKRLDGEFSTAWD
jgi:hypothetical protein